MTIEDEAQARVSWSTYLDLVYPIGSVYMSVVNTDPGSLLVGTWEQLNGSLLSTTDGTVIYGWKRVN